MTWGGVTVRNALCLAAVMAAERARVSESGAGVTSVTKLFVDDGSAARAGTDQSMVHPHERIERETTEADERMGAAKATRWRRAWGR